jgi:CheY-like chemotaxis protein
VSIPTLLVCDGDDAKQEILEGLVKNEPGLKYIATVSKSDGSRAVEQAIKVGTKLLWIDLDDEPVEGLNLLAETRQLYPQLPVVVSKSSLDADMVRASVNLGALDFLDPQSWANQIKIVVAKLQVNTAAPAAAAAPAAPAATPAQPGASKWGDLDAIPAPGATSAPATPVAAPAPATPVAAPAPAAPVAAPAPAAPVAAPAAPSPIASSPNNPIARAQETTGEIHLTVTAGSRPHLDLQPSTQQSAASQATTNGGAGEAEVANPGVVEGNKWGDLDAIGSPKAAAVAPQSAAPAPAATAAPLTVSENEAEVTGGKKWGDLDAIPTPKATLETAVPIPKPIHEAGSEKWGELDAIPGPGEKRGPAPNSLVAGGGGGKGLKRPAPEKAEMYNIPAVPIWLIVVILLAIAAAVYYMATKPH